MYHTDQGLIIVLKSIKNVSYSSEPLSMVRERDENKAWELWHTRIYVSYV